MRLVVAFSVHAYKLGCTVLETQTLLLHCSDLSPSRFILMLQDIMMNLAKAVANAAALLVLKAKNVAQVAEDTALQNRVITAATQCALSTSQLVACTKVRYHTTAVCFHGGRDPGHCDQSGSLGG